MKRTKTLKLMSVFLIAVMMLTALGAVSAFALSDEALWYNAAAGQDEDPAQLFR